MQGLSSVLGLAIVAVIIACALRRGTPQPVVARVLTQTQRRVWILSFVLLTIVLTVGLDVLVRDDELPWTALRADARNFAVSFLRGLVLAVLITGVLLRRYLRYRGSGNASTSAV